MSFPDVSSAWSSERTVGSKDSVAEESFEICLAESTGSVELEAVAEATCCLVIGARVVVLPTSVDGVILLMCQKIIEKRKKVKVLNWYERPEFEG